MSVKMRNVLVALEFYRGPLFEGIAEYARTHNWHLSLEMLANPAKIPWGWDGDGILTMLIRDDTKLIRFLRECNKPTVNLEGRRLTTSFPRVLSDTRAAAGMAFDYFRGKGFSHFAFYGPAHSVRGRDFAAVVGENGFECGVLEETDAPWREELNSVRKWLRKQPKPLAVFCWTDSSGARFIDMAHSLGFRIPEEVSVLGMDNEALICDCAAVRLSSIHTDIQSVGYLGAAKLDRLLDGGAPETENRLVPPREIVERASTNTLAAASPLVSRAIHLMQERHASGINIAGIVAACGVSRRGLEKAFLSSLGMTPHDALLKIRMDHARILLRGSAEKISSVAGQVGIGDAKHFALLFRKTSGVSPRGYRKSWDDRAATPYRPPRP